MRYFIFISILFVTTTLCQNSIGDKIITKEGITINCKIIKVDANDIEYSAKNLPFKKISRQDVLLIKYKNGEVVNFSETKTVVEDVKPKITYMSRGFYKDGIILDNLNLYPPGIKINFNRNENKVHIDNSMIPDYLNTSLYGVSYQDGAGNEARISKIRWSFDFTVKINMDGVKLLIVGFGKPWLAIYDFYLTIHFDLDNGETKTFKSSYPGFESRDELKICEFEKIRLFNQIITPKVKFFDLKMDTSDGSYTNEIILSFN